MTIFDVYVFGMIISIVVLSFSNTIKKNRKNKKSKTKTLNFNQILIISLLSWVSIIIFLLVKIERTYHKIATKNQKQKVKQPIEKTIYDILDNLPQETKMR
jgi:Na+/H+ antiporter NhaC